MILNPSFECGYDFCGAFQGSQEEIFSVYACDWLISGGGTTDIYSTKVFPKECMMHQPYEGNPHSATGDQLPNTGQRFAGLFTWNYPNPQATPDENEYREYLQIKLTEPTVPGDVYCFEMYASLADFSKFASNGLGMALSVDLAWPISYNALKLSPQIYFDKSLKDFTNWTRLGGFITPTEAFNYLVIGNFFTDPLTSFVEAHGPVQNIDAAYYYVDDVSLEKLPYDKFAFSGDTVICVNDETTIAANVGSSYVIWQKLGETDTVSVGPHFTTAPKQTTTYLATTRGCGKEVKDTVTVYVHPTLTVELPADTTICDGTSINIHAGNGYHSYLWQDQSTNEFITVSKAGLYGVTVSNSLDCQAQDEMKVSIKSIPKVDLGDDLFLCSKRFPTLRAGKGYDTYTWSSGAVDSLYTPDAAGNYRVTVANQCGEAHDEVRIFASEDIVVPNVITVNGDNLNDLLKVQPDIVGGLGAMRIFNRWGKEVYREDKYEDQWPVNGNDVAPGTYYYLYTMPGCPSIKGFIEVIK
ncbi:MAG: gliding motility-associated C-terminal domain-containing protein [Bacteroidota bacterium]